MERYLLKRSNNESQSTPSKKAPLQAIPQIPIQDASNLPHIPNDHGDADDLGIDGPCQPTPATFPKDDKGRSFNKDWFRQFP